MITFFIILAVICCAFSIAMKITGAVLLALLWVFIKLPVTLVLWAIGIICCCTLILIPVGIWLFGVGFKWLIA